MGTDTGVANGLVELLQVFLKSSTDKWGTIVTEVGLSNNAMVSTMLLKGALGCQGFM